MTQKITVNWAEVYSSLNIDFLKQTGKWMLKAILAVGVVVVPLFFFAFPHYPEVGIFLSVAFLFICLRMAWRVARLNKQPKVVVGPVTKKSTLSYRNRKTFTHTTRYYVNMVAHEAFEIDSVGRAHDLPVSNRPKRYECPTSVFKSISENELLIAVIMPHNNSVAQVIKANPIN
jgi:hypothetical protein